MKYVTLILALVCAGLAISFFVTKRSDTAQQVSDANSINDLSNQLASAQAQVAGRNQTILALSNSLDASLTVSLTLSNQLADAQSAAARGLDQITNLTRRVAQVESENQAAGRRVLDLTNQLAGLTRQAATLTNRLALTETNLNEANKEYALLEKRFRMDVAERVVAERKFNNLWELKSQLQKLKKNPAAAISAESIYAGLNVEVTSNAVHVISPN